MAQLRPKSSDKPGRATNIGTVFQLTRGSRPHPQKGALPGKRGTSREV